MKDLKTTIRRLIQEAISLDVKPGDVILTGRFKNKRKIIKSIGTDKFGQPTINGKSILKFKIEKKMPKKKWSAQSRDELKEIRQLVRNILQEYKMWNQEDCPHEKVFKQVRNSKLYGESMPQINWDHFAQEVIEEKGYENSREDFHPSYYEKFDDWFLRTLTAESLEKCAAAAEGYPIVSPCQGTVRQEVPSGNITLKKSIVHLDTLLGILNTPSIIQISLLKTDYHRIHSPCDGVVDSIEAFDQGELFNESEACTIIDIMSNEGIITLMMIGEWTVQTFVTAIRVGQTVSKLEELGYFYFGSQIILGYDGFMKMIVTPDDKTRVFPGDPLFGEHQ